MERYKQHFPFVVLEFEDDVWQHPVHKHNYYEIIFIKAGNGIHTINDVSFPYQSGDIFLLSPEDYHSFIIKEKTNFCFFKFTELVFKKDKTDYNQRKWLEKVEAIITAPNQLPGAINFSNTDKQSVLNLSAIILHEYHNESCYSPEIIADSMSTLISIVARNVCYRYNESGLPNIDKQNNANKILTYVRHNIYEPNKVTLEAIASELGLSKNYIGIFFKKNTGESLQNYILNYKLLLAENRVSNSGFTIAEIAYDLGFTDVSHLNKLFKRRFGLAPGQYRKLKKNDSAA